jgi:hypothetical protein
MSKEDDNKAVVGRWFTEFWGKTVNLGVIDEIAAPDMLLKYSLHEPRRGRADIKAFMTDCRTFSRARESETTPARAPSHHHQNAFASRPTRSVYSGFALLKSGGGKLASALRQSDL